MIKRRDVLRGGLAAGGFAALAALRPAHAQTSYPDRPIRLIIPFPPGGVYDAIGRPWADRMKSVLGTVVPENVGGAAGSVGAAMAARATPDGYTLLLGGGGTHVINPAAASRPLYNPAKDFDPIAVLAATGLVFAVHPSFPVKTLGELIAYAKANPASSPMGRPESARSITSPGSCSNRSPGSPRSCMSRIGEAVRRSPMCSADTFHWRS